MNTKLPTINVSGIKIYIVKKQIKNLHLSILPPDGKVRISAPEKSTNESIHLFVASRINWIKKQRKKFNDQERETIRDYVSGETHFLWGRKYRLEVISKNTHSKVVLNGNEKITLFVRPETSRSKKEKILYQWYRNIIRQEAGKIFQKWEKKMKVKAKDKGIRKMKTRWGTCNYKTKKILLNLELVKKPSWCLEYIIVHELLHLFERQHNENFVRLMNTYMAKWKFYREELNKFPLNHEKWKY